MLSPDSSSQASSKKDGNLFSIDLFSQLMFIEPNERPLDSKEIKPINPKGNQP